MFKSYSQNLEDVLLRRALSDVEAGQYVDIGAGHPISQSVTKGFYEIGWRGINVEPLVDRYVELCDDRPRDLNLRAVVLAETGLATVYRADRDLGAYSTTDIEVRDQLLTNGFELTEVRAASLTLHDVLALLPGDIHFLKIDVEGAELDVLRSHDFKDRRPWIVVVEVVAGQSALPERRDGIRRYLEEALYDWVFFDGLNAYYVAHEKRADLKGKFDSPVNVRDLYIRPLSESEAVRSLGEIADELECESGEGAEILERLRAFTQDRFADIEALEGRVATIEADQAAQKELWDATRVGLESDLAAASNSLDALERDRFARERYVSFLAAQLEARNAEIGTRNVELANLHLTLHDTYRSASWKLTGVLRRMRTLQLAARSGRGRQR